MVQWQIYWTSAWKTAWNYYMILTVEVYFLIDMNDMKFWKLLLDFKCMCTLFSWKQPMYIVANWKVIKLLYCTFMWAFPPFVSCKEIKKIVNFQTEAKEDGTKIVKF